VQTVTQQKRVREPSTQLKAGMYVYDSTTAVSCILLPSLLLLLPIARHAADREQEERLHGLIKRHMAEKGD